MGQAAFNCSTHSPRPAEPRVSRRGFLFAVDYIRPGGEKGIPNTFLGTWRVIFHIDLQVCCYVLIVYFCQLSHLIEQKNKHVFPRTMKPKGGGCALASDDITLVPMLRVDICGSIQVSSTDW